MESNSFVPQKIKVSNLTIPTVFVVEDGFPPETTAKAKKTHGKLIDLAGCHFGKLLVLARAPNPTARRGAYWHCQCACGKETTVDGLSLRREATRSCGCLVGERRSQPSWLTSRAKLINNYVHGAKKRDLEFKLSADECHALFKSNCHYCGIEPHRIVNHLRRVGSKQRMVEPSAEDYAEADYVYNGIDRKNPLAGYTLANCVASCKTCNVAKSFMSEAEHRSWLNRLVSYQVSRSDQARNK